MQPMNVKGLKLLISVVVHNCVVYMYAQEISVIVTDIEYSLTSSLCLLSHLIHKCK